MTDDEPRVKVTVEAWGDRQRAIRNEQMADAMPHPDEIAERRENGVICEDCGALLESEDEDCTSPICRD